MPESQQNSGRKTFANHAQYLPEFSQGSHEQLSPRAWTADDEQKDMRSMELPRGRFLGLRHNIRLAFLLGDLYDDRFTGYCRILQDKRHMVIVLEEGEIILAEYQGISGDVALDAIFISKELVVDAELNELNASQMNLALEFNPDSIVSKNHFIKPSFPYPRTNPPAEESCQPDSSGGQSSIRTPLTYLIDSSQSLRTKDHVETDPGQVEIIPFEPLAGNSVLFEARQELLRDAPDVSERWRFMGTASRENFSV